ncbi:MAG: replication restart helicase PriA [Candidatus Binatia bacterium]
MKTIKEFALVMVPSPLREPLIYSIPERFRETLEEGMRVLVPLGKRRTTGIAVGFAATTAVARVREVIDVLDPRPVFDPALIKLCRWASKYYFTPLGEVMGTLVPSNLRVESQRVAVARLNAVNCSGKLENDILAEVRDKGRIPVKSLGRKFPGAAFYRALERLVSLGAIEIQDRLRGKTTKASGRSEDYQGSAGLHAPVIPTFEQDNALHAIRERLEQGGFEAFLLFGVTGSGKTEVYLRAMEHVWQAGKQSLILVPEISLTPLLLDRLRERFAGKVGVLHSGLTASQRRSQWWKIRGGEVVLVVGARSAVFAPLPNLGLIIVDEEHDPSYKQGEGFRYHARDLAVVRAHQLGCPVVLGSATPALESFENARSGRYRLLELPHRVEGRPLPEIDMVDLRPKAEEIEAEKYEGRPDAKPWLLSASLRAALLENHARGLQSLIFLNRRGFANFLQCRLCGFVQRCSHCSVTLTLHLKQRSLVCHHCGFRQAAGDDCPSCGNASLASVGFGTEQVERQLAELVPGARVARMDRDTTQRRGSQEALLREWESGKIQILAGTQMITKGHDVGGVTLVGVLLADLSLNVPDFRAAERTFQLLSQVAGRAGRGSEPGRVIVQTYAPDHYTLGCVREHDYRGFFDLEIEFRRALNYPPFGRLVLLRVDGPKPEEVEDRAVELGKRLRAKQKKSREAAAAEILGPAPAPIERLRGRYRWQILCKGRRQSELAVLAEEARKDFEKVRSARLHIDVDPYNML